MKVLVIGGGGFLGTKLQDILRVHDYDVSSTYNHTIPADMQNSYPLDITVKKDVDTIIKKIAPDVIIHAAALTNVDECERNKGLADAINVEGTRNVALVAKKIDAKVVYVSTDYVFDGTKGLYKEQDAVCPVNHYGVTKLKGEEIVRTLVDEWLIVRPSVIYGAGTKKNFAMWILENLQRQNRIRIVSDQFVSPTLNTDVSEQVVALLKHDVTGVFHTAGGERVDRYSFSQIVADVFGLDSSLIQGISMTEMTWVARRPVDSSLDVSMVTRFKKPYKLKEAVNLLKEEIERRL